MEILCTRPGCSRPLNQFSDLDDPTHLKTAQQKYCTSCGMHLILGGRYLPEKLLGQGGFGAAFLARDRYTPTMRRCVVKQFQPMGNLDDQQLALAQDLFEREAHVLERIGNRHKQIPDLYAFFPLIVPDPQGGKTNQYFYLVQEYIEGEDFEQILEREGKLPETTIKEILVSMLGVLAFVHQEGTIHRDIKPSNIMRRSDGELYLLDFGAVKEVAAGAGVGSVSQRSTGIYSPGYAPPEQMRGAQVFPSTDLYALAVTCIVLLTGESPEDLFDGYSNIWQWRKFAPSVDAQLGQVLDQMLETTPGDRPSSAQAVLDLFQSSPVTPPPSSSTKIQAPAPAPTPTPTSQGRSPKPKPKAVPGKVKPVPVQKQTPPPVPQKSGSIIPALMGAGFTGFSGTLLFLITRSLIGGSLGIGIWGAAMGGLIFSLSRKIIETKEMAVFGVILTILSLIVVRNVAFVPMLVIAVLAGAALVAIFSLFTLIYRILQSIF